MRRALVAWARDEGYDEATVALLASSTPSAAKKWGREHEAPERVFEQPEQVQLRLRLEPVPQRRVVGDPAAFGFTHPDKTRFMPFASTREQWIAEYDEWVEDLDAGERDVIEQYTGPHAAEFNDGLRDDPDATVDDFPDSQLLCEALERAPRAPAPRTLLRGVSAPYRLEGSASDWARRMFPVGATWYDRAFLSTTRSPGTAVSFGSDMARGVIFEMRSRGGVCVARVSEHESELEHVFPPRIRWRVVGHAESVAFSYAAPGSRGAAPLRRPVVFLVDEADLAAIGVDTDVDAKGWEAETD